MSLIAIITPLLWHTSMESIKPFPKMTQKEMAIREALTELPEFILTRGRTTHYTHTHTHNVLQSARVVAPLEQSKEEPPFSHQPPAMSWKSTTVKCRQVLWKTRKLSCQSCWPSMSADAVLLIWEFPVRSPPPIFNPFTPYHATGKCNHREVTTTCQLTESCTSLL